MNFFVYIHRRATDGKIFYVGKGCRYRHKSTWARSQYWQNTVAKYGYVAEIVKNGLDEKEAFDLERVLIKKYKKYGLCNLTDGGEGASGVVISDETKEKHRKMRQSHKWRKNLSEKAKERFQDPHFRAEHAKRAKIQMQSLETRRKISEKVTQYFADPKAREQNRQKTIKFFTDPQAREHARQKALARFDTPEKRAAHAQAKAVLCVETGVVFGTGTLAAEWVAAQGIYKGDNSSIAKVCRGEKETAFGYHWRYVKKRSTGSAKRPQAD